MFEELPSCLILHSSHKSSDFFVLGLGNQHFYQSSEVTVAQVEEKLRLEEAS